MFWAGQMAGIASGTAGFAVDAADFDGTNDYMTRGAGFTGAADSSTGIISFWFRIDGGDAALQTIFKMIVSATDTCSVTRTAGNKFQVQLRPSGAGTTYNFTSTTSYTTSTTWRHFLASWNVNAAQGAKDANSHLYITNTSDFTAGTDNGGAFNVDYTQTNWAVGADTDGTNKVNMALAEFYFAPGQYLDFSTSANRGKFISGGKPVNLGGTGSVPTGTSPIAYFRLLNGDAASQFGTNLGTGGDFDVTGALSTASSSPSD